jgi:Uma2 family endonuclease
MVICGPVEFEGERQEIVRNPRFIIEVLSPSTANYDRGEKFLHYRSIPTLYDYLVLAQDSVQVEHYTRQTDHSWLFANIHHFKDAVHIASAGAKNTLAAIYDL